jgi:transposase
MEDVIHAEETVTIPKAEYESLKQQVAWLMGQLKLSKHRQYGISSEKSEYDQLGLFDEAEATACISDAEPGLEEVKAYRRKKSRDAAERLPSDLPVEVIEHELPTDQQVCPKCSGHLHVMGRETREELKIIPAKAVVLRHVQHVYACRCCERTGESVPIVKAPMPEPVMKGSFASPESVAHIAVQKFVMGVPLYRQEQEWERNGIKLSRQTMSNWLLRCAEDWLTQVYDKLHEQLSAREVLHADETTLQVLREPGRKAQSKSYMWLYRTSGDAQQQIVLYDYQPSRSGEHPAAFLKKFSGFLHTDGYAGYHSSLPDKITVVGCWAHVRRKFDEALKVLSEKQRARSESLRGKQFCDRLFSLERDFAGLPPDERYLARLEQSRPMMEDFFNWADRAGALPKVPLGQAIRYALDQQRWLSNVLLDGRLELSNNRAERSIKPFVIGRKNWLFNNTPKGAAASAMIYSLIETAKENGLNPHEYLMRLFHTAPNLQDGDSIDALLPWNLCPRV